MKLVVWDEADDPFKATIDDYGDVIFYDEPTIGNFEVGDQIQYHTPLSVACYIVVDVEPASPFTGKGKQVTVRAMDGS